MLVFTVLQKIFPKSHNKIFYQESNLSNCTNLQSKLGF